MIQQKPSISYLLSLPFIQTSITRCSLCCWRCDAVLLVYNNSLASGVEPLAGGLCFVPFLFWQPVLPAQPQQFSVSVLVFVAIQLQGLCWFVLFSVFLDGGLCFRSSGSLKLDFKGRVSDVLFQILRLLCAEGRVLYLFVLLFVFVGLCCCLYPFLCVCSVSRKMKIWVVVYVIMSQLMV